MHKLYLGLGSNLGNRIQNIQKAIEMIDEQVGSVYRISTFMETTPVGFRSENRFINVVCLVHTHFSPHRCLEETQRIERELGRERKTVDGVYEDRTIDIDLLMYDDVEICDERLSLPHPRMHERNFVMEPLEEILEDERKFTI